MKYVALLIFLNACGSSSTLNERRYDASRTSLFTLKFEGSHTFRYRERYGTNSHGFYSNISPTERVLRGRWQDLSALPASLDSVRVPLASTDSTYVLLATNIDAGSIGFYRHILSFVVETPRGRSAPVSYLSPAALSRLRPGDSLRVSLTLDPDRIVPKPVINPVSSQWLRVTGDDTVLRVRLDMDTRAFSYRVVNDTLRATRRGWQ